MGQKKQVALKYDEDTIITKVTWNYVLDKSHVEIVQCLCFGFFHSQLIQLIKWHCFA